MKTKIIAEKIVVWNAKIVAEKLITWDEKMYKIKSIENVLKKKDLPEEYLNGVCFYKDFPFSQIHFDNFEDTGMRTWSSIVVGAFIPEGDMKCIISAMDFAGRRLKHINEKLNELKNWTGEVEFTV